MAEPYLTKLTEMVHGARLEADLLAETECRHFFSGAAMYFAGKICVSLTPVGLAMKLPSSTLEDLMSSGVSRPLRYFEKGPVKKGYALLNEAFASDMNRVSPLLSESIKHAQTQG